MAYTNEFTSKYDEILMEQNKNILLTEAKQEYQTLVEELNETYKMMDCLMEIGGIPRAGGPTQNRLNAGMADRVAKVAPKPPEPIVQQYPSSKNPPTATTNAPKPLVRQNDPQSNVEELSNRMHGHLTRAADAIQKLGNPQEGTPEHEQLKKFHEVAKDASNRLHNYLSANSSGPKGKTFTMHYTSGKPGESHESRIQAVHDRLRDLGVDVKYNAGAARGAKKPEQATA